MAQRIDKKWITTAQVIVPLIVGLAFAAVEVQRVAVQIAVRYPDFFSWAERAARFDLRHLSHWDWVNGLYPLGYPLLLRLGVALGLDVLRTAFLISILGGLVGLLSTFWLVWRITCNWTLAVFSQIALASTSYYLFYANLDSTDMLAAGLQILSFTLLLRRPDSRRAVLCAGFSAGFSYLIRYTASLTILLCALFLIGPALRHRRKENVEATVIYSLGALIGAAPQLIASTLIKGNPFYSHQAHNLWFHLQNSADYIRVWHAVPMDISLWEVISEDPGRFFSHWWDVFQSAWLTGDAIALDAPLGMLTHAGLLFAILAPGMLKRSARGFVALYTVGMLALLSFTRLDRRFLITLMPFEILGSLYFLWNVIPATLNFRRFAVPVRILVLVLLTLQLLRYPLTFMRANPPDTQIVEVSNVLHGAGMESASEVLSTHVDFHDVADPWKRRFDMAFALAQHIDTYEELLSFLQQRGYKFFIFDKQTGLFLYPDMEFLRYPENRPNGLVPVFVQDQRDFAIYRVAASDWPEPHPVGAEFENEITLTAYDLFHSSSSPPGADRQLGLYLHWETIAPIDAFLKVFVHVFDETGQLVAQHDSVPALWTHPTHDWTVGEKVIDFHPVLFDAALGRGPFTVQVGLYDAGTLQRISILDPSGVNGEQPLDAVTLVTFVFD